MAKNKGLSGADEQIESVIMKPASVIDKAAKTKTGQMIGSLAFVIGFGLAVLFGLLAGLQAVGINLGIATATGAMMGFLALLGLIVGLVNISDREATGFLVGAIAITAGSASMTSLANLQGLGAIAAFLSVLMQSVAVFMGPAALIVGLKVVYSAAREA